MSEPLNSKRRLSQTEELEQQMRDAHQTYLEASLDESSPVKGGSLTPAGLAWMDLQGHREMYRIVTRKDDDEMYKTILTESLARPDHWD